MIDLNNICSIGHTTFMILSYLIGIGIAKSHNLEAITEIKLHSGQSRFFSPISPEAEHPPTIQPNNDSVHSSELLINNFFKNVAISSLFGLQEQEGVFLDSTERFLYLTQSDNKQVVKVDLISGIRFTFAGVSSTQGSVGDGGQATSALLSNPVGISITASGQAFVADLDMHVVRKIAADGIITTYAGTAGVQSIVATASNGDNGAATSATISFPYYIAIDTSNNLYIPSFTDNKVRKIDPSTQIITTLAGTGESGLSRNGTVVSAAKLSFPTAVFIDSVGKVFISDAGNKRIRVIGIDNKISSFVGTDSFTSAIEIMPATSSSIDIPYGIWGNTVGDIYYADAGRRRMYRVDKLSGLVSTVAGGGTSSTSVYTPNGQLLSLQFFTPTSLWGGDSGKVFVGDNALKEKDPSMLVIRTGKLLQQSTVLQSTSMSPTAIQTIPTYQMFTIAGTGTAGTAVSGTSGVLSALNNPHGMYCTPNNALIIAEYANFRVLRVDLVTHILTIFGGDGTSGNSGDDGQVTSAKFMNPIGITKRLGDTLISDYNDHRIRKVATTGIIVPFAGTGVASSISTDPNGDGGSATSATLNLQCHLFADSSGYVYIADHGNNKIRKVDFFSNIISTIAGTGSAAFGTGSSVVATSAILQNPLGIFVDTAGTVYFTEFNGLLIDVVSTSGAIYVLAGDRTLVARENVPATSTGMYFPGGIWVNTIGDVFYCDSSNGKVRVISAISGIVNTIAGNGNTVDTTFVNAGAALNMRLVSPKAICGSLNTGALYISDGSGAGDVGNTIRSIYVSTQSPSFSPTYAPSVVPTVPVYQLITVAGTGTQGTANDGDVATSVGIKSPYAIFFELATNSLYTADGTYRLCRIDLTTGITHVVAGNGVELDAGDGGPSTSASLVLPTGIWRDTSAATAITYIADYNSHKIRAVQNNMINRVAGTGVASTQAADNNGDGGAATAATLWNPASVVLDSTGNLILADFNNYRVRRVDSVSNIITTIVGTGSVGTDIHVNGAATTVLIDKPLCLFIDSAGVLYMSPNTLKAIQTVSVSGIVSLFVGNTNGAVLENVPATATAIGKSGGIWGNTVGDIFFADQNSRKLRVASKFSGLVTTIAGSGETSVSMFISSALALSVPILAPRAVTGSSSNGLLFVSDLSPAFGGSTIRMLFAATASPSTLPTALPTYTPTAAPTLSTYQLYTVAGNGVAGSAADGAVAAMSSVNQPDGLYLDSFENMLYFADRGNFRVRKVNIVSGIVSVFAGDGTTGNDGDGGKATAARFTGVTGVCGSTSGVIFISDYNAFRIRAVSTDGIIRNYAGIGASPAATTDANDDGGPASSAFFGSLRYITADTANNLYIAEYGGNKIRKITMSNQIISTMAGTGTCGADGNSGAASAAKICSPIGVFVDSVGKLYLCDSSFRRVKVVDTNNIISIFAGYGGTVLGAPDSPATSSGLSNPVGVWGNSMGDVYIAASANHRLRVVSSFSGSMNTIAGNGLSATSAAFESSGPALAMSLITPFGVAGDSTGQVYVSAFGNTLGGGAVRGVYASTIAPTTQPSLSPTSATPTISPSSSPSTAPTLSPTNLPSIIPSALPSPIPSALPSVAPSRTPSLLPSEVPSITPSAVPTTSPSVVPTTSPSVVPSITPSVVPSITPSLAPSVTPSVVPTSTPSAPPSQEPSKVPSHWPSQAPSTTPSTTPSTPPSRIPSSSPTIAPSVVPSLSPSFTPSVVPTATPSVLPIVTPTTLPTVVPSIAPTTSPTISSAPSFLPSSAPTLPVYQMYTVAGNGVAGNGEDGVVATSSSIKQVEGTFEDSTSSSLFFVDTGAFIVRKVSLEAGITFVFAGGGSGGDGSRATSASLAKPQGVCGNSMGVVYISEDNTARVRQVSASDGIISPYAGSGTASASVSNPNGDGGPATSATFRNIRYIFCDTSDNLYILDFGERKVRKVTAHTQVITTLAGTGTSASTGDGGQATSALIGGPYGIFVDTMGAVFVSEYTTKRVRKIDANNIISTIAGNGGATLVTNSPATSTGISIPTGVWGNTIGDLFYNDYGNAKVRVVNAFSGFVYSIAGSGVTPSGYVSSGPALSISIAGPSGLSGDGTGRLFMADFPATTGGSAIRGIVPNTVAPTQIPSMSPTTVPSALPTVSQMPCETPTQTPTKFLSTTPSLAPSSQMPSLSPATLPSFSPTLHPMQTTVFPYILPTLHPTTAPSLSPNLNPSEMPTTTLTETPTSDIPILVPSILPTYSPSREPSVNPTEDPTYFPSLDMSSEAPTAVSTTGVPSMDPSPLSTTVPSVIITNQPSEMPSAAISKSPSAAPTTQPTMQPSIDESINQSPSIVPSIVPLVAPTLSPTIVPTAHPTSLPSPQPTCTLPTRCPTMNPTTQLITTESETPSMVPTATQSVAPTQQPSTAPVESLTEFPSVSPSAPPFSETSAPSEQPTLTPSCNPVTLPTTLPTIAPATTSPTASSSLTLTELSSLSPSTLSSNAPSLTSSESIAIPTKSPTCNPSTTPSLCPSTDEPSRAPTPTLTSEPSVAVTPVPQLSPTLQPSNLPTHKPSGQPSVPPSNQPSWQPSKQPSCQPSSHPSKHTPVIPTQSPTRLSRGNFPSNHSISVLFSNVKPTAFKIVLPFSRVTANANALKFNGFYDISLSSMLISGEMFVVNGDDYSTNHIDLTTLIGDGVRKILPAISYDYSGRSVSNAGDINGDGYDDLIIGVPYAARCYVLFGTVQGFVNMTQGFTIFGAQLSDLTGWSVGGAGDANNDTLADIVIGAPYARNVIANCGAVYVLYGKQSGFQDINLDALLPDLGYVIFGSGEGDTLGVSVSSAGDVNGDGYDDIAIGALKSNALYRGGAYVVYGSNALRDSLHLSALKSQEGFSMLGAVWSYSGYAVSGAVDVNGDRFDDVLIGSVPFKTTFGVQTTYLVYGNDKTAANAIGLSTLSKQQGVVMSGGGVVVSGVGDINHDGHDDIMIGSNYGFNGAGFVVFTNVTDHTFTLPPSTTPSPTPVTASPSVRPTRLPTEVPSKRPTISPTQRPTRSPTLFPSARPTVLQTGPSQPPTIAPTGPTSTPSSIPTVNTENPSCQPSTSYPSSRPSSKPTSLPTARPSEATKQPTRPPSHVPSTPLPSIAVSISPFRSRNPVLTQTSASPTQFRSPIVFYIHVGGSYEKQTNMPSNYVIDTNETVHITGRGFSGGNIYTVLPHRNGSLHIEIFNNISDKLNLTSHNDIHSMTDLVITSGSVIITFPITGQRIRLANLTPLDISENNFLFSERTDETVSDNSISQTRGVVIAVISFAVLSSIGLFVFYVMYKRRKQLVMEFKAGIIALEDNPTRLVIAVNDMYAHFDAYIPPSTVSTSEGVVERHKLSPLNSRKSHLSGVSGVHSSGSREDETKSNEPSPLTSFEQQINSILNQNDTELLRNNSGNSVSIVDSRMSCSRSSNSSSSNYGSAASDAESPLISIDTHSSISKGDIALPSGFSSGHRLHTVSSSPGGDAFEDGSLGSRFSGSSSFDSDFTISSEDDEE